MPLIATGLSAVIKTKLDAKFPVSGFAGASAQRQDFCDCIAEAVVQYIVANNMVTVTCPAGAGIGAMA